MRVSVSKVESWLYYARSEYKTLDELRADLMDESPETPEMRAGHAFHQIFENNGPGLAADVITAGGFNFHFNADIEVPAEGVPEVRCEHTYYIDDEPVTLRGRVDRVLGITVTDYKMIKQFQESDYLRFQDAFQWRAYLDMMGATAFRYLLFIKQMKGEDVYINDMHTLLFHAYPGLHGDVELRLREFLAFIKQHVPEFYERQVARDSA